MATWRQLTQKTYTYISTIHLIPGSEYTLSVKQNDTYLIELWVGGSYISSLRDKLTFINPISTNEITLKHYGQPLIDQIKLEETNTVTPWIPASEDVIANLSWSKNELGDLENVIDSMNVNRLTGTSLVIEGASDNLDVLVEGNSVKLSGPDRIVDVQGNISITGAGTITLPTLRKLGSVADTYNPITGEYVKRINDWGANIVTEWSTMTQDRLRAKYVLVPPVVTYLTPTPIEFYSYIVSIQTDAPDYCKPMLAVTTKARDYLKEKRTINNILLWNRALNDAELIHQYKLFHERYRMKSPTLSSAVEESWSINTGLSVESVLSSDITIIV